MREEEKLFLGNTLFRVDRVYDQLIADHDPDNRIAIYKLKIDENFIEGYINKDTESISPAPGREKGREMKFRIPVYLYESGYTQGSSFAELFNKEHLDAYNIRLLDRDALMEIADRPLRYKQPALPEINAHGYTFVVDVAYGEIRRKDNPMNYLLFHDMNFHEGKGGGYDIYIDKESGNPASERMARSYVPFHLDEMVKIDPIGVAAKYGISVTLLPNSDLKLENNPQAFDHRVNGEQLPIIRIIDRDFVVDLWKNELRSTEGPKREIDLSQVPYTMEEDKYTLFWDYKKREPVNINEDTITSLPKNVVMVTFPTDERLDPIGWARKEGYEQLIAEFGYPQQMKMEARVYPVTQSWLPYLIEENLRERLVQQNRGLRL